MTESIYDRRNPHHPNDVTAMTLGDIVPDLSFLCYLLQGPIRMLGRFATEPSYNEGDSRWTVEVKLPGIEPPRTVSLYDLGITPDGDGLYWSEAVTVELQTTKLDY